MYLFSRFRRVNSASAREAVAAAVEVAGMASTISGLPISSWITIASPEVGRINWSTTFEHLADFQAANDKLNDSKDYGDWADAHDKLFDGPAEDALMQIIHGVPDPDRTVNFVAGTRVVCATGKVGEATAAGVELAELATKISGQPMLVGATLTGLYGAMVFISGGESLAVAEEAQAALGADPSWLSFLDDHAALFQPGAETTWFQRLS